MSTMSLQKSQRRIDVAREGSSLWLRVFNSDMKDRIASVSKVSKSPGQSFSLPSPQRITEGWL